jgi:tetrahydromethanopterin S-methyltransferase subunit E
LQSRISYDEYLIGVALTRASQALDKAYEVQSDIYWLKYRISRIEDKLWGTGYYLRYLSSWIAGITGFLSSVAVLIVALSWIDPSVLLISPALSLIAAVLGVISSVFGWIAGIL